jgi:hypothetical protein
LTGDPGLRDPALSLAAGSTGLEDASELRAWVYTLLYDTGYGVVVEDLLWVSNRGGDVEAARRMRLEVSRIDLALIRWDVVIDLIKASIKNDSKEK